MGKASVRDLSVHYVPPEGDPSVRGWVVQRQRKRAVNEAGQIKHGGRRGDVLS